MTRKLGAVLFFLSFFALTTALDSVAATTELLLKQARSLEKEKKFKEAAEVYWKAAKGDLNNVALHHLYQDAADRAGETKKAILRYARLRKLYPDQWIFQYLYGRIVRDLKTKEACYKKAVELNPKAFWPHYGLGYLYAVEGLKKKALDEFAKAQRINPHSADVLVGVGYVHAYANENDQAIAAFKKALEIDPACVDAYLNLGYVYKRIGDLTKAQEMFQKALEIDPENADAHNNLGSVFHRLRLYHSAISEYRAALKTGRCAAPEVVWLNMGLAHHRLGEEDKAIEAYKKALSLRPNFAYAHNCIAKVYLHEGQLALAEEHARKAERLGYAMPKGFWEALKKAKAESSSK